MVYSYKYYNFSATVNFSKIYYYSIKDSRATDDSELKIINNSNVDFHTSTFYYEENKCIKLKNPLQYRRQWQQQPQQSQHIVILIVILSIYYYFPGHFNDVDSIYIEVNFTYSQLLSLNCKYT